MSRELARLARRPGNRPQSPVSCLKPLVNPDIIVILNVRSCICARWFELFLNAFPNCVGHILNDETLDPLPDETCTGYRVLVPNVQPLPQYVNSLLA